MATPASATGPVNMGNPAEYSILEIANIVIELTNSRSRIVHRASPMDDPKQRRPDISLAQQLFGWGPRIALKDGLQQTINYFDRLLAQPDVQAYFAAAPSVG
jgi:UDP-glucuronate decarboxylase